MRVDNPFLTDEVILRELGTRLAQVRVERNVSQKQLADEAGVSKTTVERAETGQSVTLTNFLKILRAAELLSGLEALVPAAAVSPVEIARMQSRQRKRSSSGRSSGRREAPSTENPFRWGDEGSA